MGILIFFFFISTISSNSLNFYQIGCLESWTKLVGRSSKKKKKNYFSEYVTDINLKHIKKWIFQNHLKAVEMIRIALII